MANQAPDNLSPQEDRTGLVMLYTGQGKGKTTAALGAVFRAWGWDWRLCVIQFIKCPSDDRGEVRAAQRLGIEWHALGDGFTWASEDLEATAARARDTWRLAQEKIESGAYDLVVLDEMTYAFTNGWLDLDGVLEWLDRHRPRHTSLIVTGRNAPEGLVEFADLVTDMVNVKHPFGQGLAGRRGIEF